MKKWKFLFAVCAFASGRLAAAGEVNPTSSVSTSETKPKSGKYLVEEPAGYGGSLLLLYGNGGSLSDTASAGLRGFMHLGSAMRLGAIGTMSWKTNNGNPNTNWEMAGSLGLFGEYLLRFDPLIFGLGVKAAGGWHMSHDRNVNMSGTSYMYFNGMPFAEIEVRLTEYISTSLYGGYDYFLGNSGSPNISQGVVGLAITLAKF